jgi:ribulose-phosphate 3-epimerase
MSVNPGFGGQSFSPFVLKKIEDLARRLARVSPRPELEVDGGITIENCRGVAQAGASIVVAGSAIFGAQDPRAAIQKMREQLG